MHDPGGRSKPKWPAGSKVSDYFSECNLYRYSLCETWDSLKPSIMWLLMNPSVAGIDHSDPTLIKTGKYSRRWGYGSQFITNVHAYRITDSKLLIKAIDPIGPENDDIIINIAKNSNLVMLAYGKPPKPLQARASSVVSMLRAEGVKLAYLRLAKDKTPYHPLYLPDSLDPIMIQ